MAALESFAPRGVAEAPAQGADSPAPRWGRAEVIWRGCLWSLGLPARLWCSDFANMITDGGTGSRVAKSWLAKPRISPQIGAMVVTSRRGGGHVGIVSGFDAKGDPIVHFGKPCAQGRRGGLPTLARPRLC
jgi:hypothetical protein